MPLIEYLSSTSVNNRKHRSYVRYKLCFIGNSGLPTDGNVYGNGVTILGRVSTEVWQQNYRFKSTAVINNGCRSLEQQLSFNENGKCNNAYKILSSLDMLLGSYGVIKSKPVSMTKGIDKERLDGIDMNYFVRLNKDLMDESWKPRPYLEKEKRPLGIGSPRDKIVQESMKAVLESILESKFLDCSHGYRKNRGCHSALGKIRYWKGIKWFINGDIESFFDDVDHDILEKLIKEHIEDQQFIDLYWKLVKAGYVDFKTLKESTKVVPQGGIISPILSNLYLHELDKFIEEERLMLDNKYKKTNIRNKVYDELDNRIQNITKLERKYKAQGRTLSEEVKRERVMKIKERRKVKATIPDPDTAKIYYERCADDWIIGVRGRYKYAAELKSRIEEFLIKTLKLRLSKTKTRITDAEKGNPARFLGTNITKVSESRKDKQIKFYRNKHGHKTRISTTAVRMTAPINDLINKMIDKGLAKYKIDRFGNKTIQGVHKGAWVNLPIKDMVVRYKAVLNGILNYYSFVDNRSRLNVIYWILLSGLAKTIANKKKMKSMKRVFKKYGKELQFLPESVPFDRPNLDKKPKRFLHKMFQEKPRFF